MADYAPLTGATFTGAVKGIDPVAATDFVTRGFHDRTAHSYLTTGVTWDPATQTLSASYAMSGVAIRPGDAVILGIPNSLSGQTTATVDVNIDGRSGELRTYEDRNINVRGIELHPGVPLLLFAFAGTSWRLLEPHIIVHAGDWRNDRWYLEGQEVDRNGTLYKLLDPSSFNNDPETHPTAWFQFTVGTGGNHIRYLALGADAVFTEADYTAGRSS